MKGWECPKCGTINAPWKGSCNCVKSCYIYKEKNRYDELNSDNIT
jgi:hypothetical protein